MIDREGRAFIPDQFVVISSSEEGGDEIGYIRRYLPGAFYELNLLCNHSVSSGYDPVYVNSSASLRPATIEEILASKREWEGANNHELPFTINTIFEGIHLIGPPER